MRSVAEATARVNIWEGSVRSGKTIASIVRWLTFLSRPPLGGQYVMVGRTRDSIARNVFDVMQDPSIFGDLTDHIHYTAGAPTALILGRKVHVMGAHDVQSEKTLRGLTVAGAYADEVTVLQPDFFRQLLARMSVKGAMCFGTTNPDNPAHWFKTEFLDRVEELRNWRTWHFNLDDNPSLEEEYKDSLKREYTGLWYRRFILGEWVAADGAVFDMWNPDQHVIAWEDLPRMVELISVGIDYGTTNPTVAILAGLGVDNRIYLIDEWDHEAGSAELRWTDAELSRGVKAWLHRPRRAYSRSRRRSRPTTGRHDPGRPERQQLPNPAVAGRGSQLRRRQRRALRHPLDGLAAVGGPAARHRSVQAADQGVPRLRVGLESHRGRPRQADQAQRPRTRCRALCPDVH
jgi:PBSX family phage terminase large subunit